VKAQIQSMRVAIDSCLVTPWLPYLCSVLLSFADTIPLCESVC